MSQSNPNGLRIGDRVKIIRPLRLIRCGYPLGVEEARQVVAEQYSKQLGNLLEGIRGEAPSEFGNYIGRYDKDRAYNRLINAAAFAYLEARAYGGSDRTLHTEELPALQDAEFVVYDVNRCMTGEREASWYDPYDGEGENATLRNRAVHVILETKEVWRPTTQAGHQIAGPLYDGYKESFRIEAIHCQKVVHQS